MTIISNGKKALSFKKENKKLALFSSLAQRNKYIHILKNENEINHALT